MLSALSAMGHPARPPVSSNTTLLLLYPRDPVSLLVYASGLETLGGQCPL